MYCLINYQLTENSELDLDKIESMLDMIEKMNDILRDDPMFDRAIKCMLELTSFECY